MARKYNPAGDLLFSTDDIVLILEKEDLALKRQQQQQDQQQRQELDASYYCWKGQEECAMQVHATPAVVESPQPIRHRQTTAFLRKRNGRSSHDDDDAETGV